MKSTPSPCYAIDYSTLKPRLCHDERFLNLWIKELPLKLDYISDLPRYVGRSHFQTTMDDESGYDHIELSEESTK